MVNLDKPAGDISHIQRACHLVQQADADQNEGRADSAHDQILIGGPKGASIFAKPNQRIG
ncbi:hypothetical protein swp_0935 [Shewanella piezotolerans WP3]|uniref:Uncharacterized protein n=1 Tax=Shewanella piezotolerans (strain WP3 / JCM 13877) TaxID=225849 RepID=B8CK38_SHEPW|nr:hypothetical protein swp_0935 [Shewanella piezotolerans WP3]